MRNEKQGHKFRKPRCSGHHTPPRPAQLRSENVLRTFLSVSVRFRTYSERMTYDAFRPKRLRTFDSSRLENVWFLMYGKKWFQNHAAVFCTNLCLANKCVVIIIYLSAKHPSQIEIFLLIRNQTFSERTNQTFINKRVANHRYKSKTIGTEGFKLEHLLG